MRFLFLIFLYCSCSQYLFSSQANYKSIIPSAPYDDSVIQAQEVARDEDGDFGETTQVILTQAIIPEAVVVIINQGQDARNDHSYLADACQYMGSRCSCVGNVCYNECNFIAHSCDAAIKRCGLVVTSCGESIGDTCTNSCQCMRNRQVVSGSSLRVSTLPLGCAFITGICIHSCFGCLLNQSPESNYYTSESSNHNCCCNIALSCENLCGASLACPCLVCGTLCCLYALMNVDNIEE